MATTETKTGFRLPWSQDHTETDEPSGDAGAVAEATAAAPTQTDADSSASQETERPDMIDATTAATNEATEAAAAPADAWPAPVEPAAPASPEPPAAAAARKPNKLMADLAKAMQTAAEGARADTLEKFASDAKSHIEAIQNDSATEAADLRRQADDDIAGDPRLVQGGDRPDPRGDRAPHHRAQDRAGGRARGPLPPRPSRRIARVQARVDAFEAEMAYFFEVLLAEEDPTKLAAMAQSLPEPPDFDDETADPAPAPAAVAEVAEAAVESQPEPAAEFDVWAVPDVPAQSPAEVEAALEAIAAAAQAADVAEAAARVEAEAQAVTAEADAEIADVRTGAARPGRGRRSADGRARPDAGRRRRSRSRLVRGRHGLRRRDPDHRRRRPRRPHRRTRAGRGRRGDRPEHAQGRDGRHPGHRGRPGQRRQHRRLQAPPRSRRRRPVGRRLVRPRR